MISVPRSLFGSAGKQPQHKPPVPRPLPGPRAADRRGDGLSPGNIILGKYEVARKLGEGGFGAVVLAKWPQSDDVIALEVVRADLASSPEVYERSKKEAAIWINIDGWEGLGASLLFSGAEPRETMQALFHVLSINMRNFSAWCYLGQLCARVRWQEDAHRGFLMVLECSHPNDKASAEAPAYVLSQNSKLPEHAGAAVLDWETLGFVPAPPKV